MRLLFAGYNTPCLVPKVLLKHVLIYLGPLKYQENLKTKVVQNLFFLGGGGVVGANSSMLTKLRKIIEKRYLLQQGAQKL